MDPKSEESFEVYCEFLQMYSEKSPENFIIFIGNKEDLGVGFALKLQAEGNVKKICIVKGGIDAMRVDFSDLLRKGKPGNTFKDTLSSFESFIKKNRRGHT